MPGRLEAAVSDSAPYDAITYSLNGRPIAEELVANAEWRLKEIEAAPEEFMAILKGSASYRSAEDTGPAQGEREDQ